MGNILERDYWDVCRELDGDNDFQRFLKFEELELTNEGEEFDFEGKGEGWEKGMKMI